MLDAHLSKRSYLVGEGLTVADFNVASPLVYVGHAGLPVDAYPHLREWSDRVLGLRAWRETAPMRRAVAA